MKRKREKTSAEEFAEAAAKEDRATYVLQLYVTGMTPKSTRTIADVKKLCEKHLTGRYELDVIDIYQQLMLAKEEQIIATLSHTLKLALPLSRLIGDITDTGRFLVGIGLKLKSSNP